MILRKWDYERNEYLPYAVPDEWYVTAGLPDLINCAQCGSLIKYGDAFSSLEVHTYNFDKGYEVCRSCHVEEENRQRLYMNKEGETK